MRRASRTSSSAHKGAEGQRGFVWRLGWVGFSARKTVPAPAPCTMHHAPCTMHHAAAPRSPLPGCLRVLTRCHTPCTNARTCVHVDLHVALLPQLSHVQHQDALHYDDVSRLHLWQVTSERGGVVG
jgi:hypothetical protein